MMAAAIRIFTLGVIRVFLLVMDNPLRN